MSSQPEDEEAGEYNVEEDTQADSPDLPDETLIEHEDIASEAAEGTAVNGHVDHDVDTIPQLERQDYDNDSIEEQDQDTVNGTTTPRRRPPAAASSPLAHSVDDSASIPDDTPSLRDSQLSSPHSDATPPHLNVPRKGSAVARPAFDRRFQSRLSGSFLGSPRANSPAFLNIHSRHSSMASFGPQSDSAAEDHQAPWDVVRWTRLRKLTGQAFSETGRRNFGSPTCLAVTDHIVVGTSRGLVLVFDHQQNSKAIIGAGTKAAESGPVTALAISADHSALAAGHAQGHIFTWEIARPGRPFLHIPALEASQPEARKGDGHIKGSAVLHIGFLGYRRTALVSADDKGMAFSHLASRGTGAIARSVKTTRILGRYPELVVRRAAKPVKKSSVLAFSPLPLGNVEQNTDTMGLVAMLTPYLLVIVSTTPIAQTQHKAARPKEVAAHSAMTAALAWFPAVKPKGTDSEISKTKLVYVWSNVLSIIEVHEAPKDDATADEKLPELQFVTRSRYQAEEAIVAVQWLSRSVIAALTITQQLLIIEDVTMNMTDSFDLLPKNIYHADLYSQQLHAIIEHHDEDEEDSSMHGVVADGYHMSFRGYKGRLFLLGFNDMWWGALTNWADRLLAMMEAGDYIGAIRVATTYYAGSGEKATIGLPEDDETRAKLVNDKLLEMMAASLRYAFGKNEKTDRVPQDRAQLVDLAVACIAACLRMQDQDYLFDDVFTWYDDNDAGDIFVDVLEPHILDRQVSTLPPPVVKRLINHYATTHTASHLEEIICFLDATSMDVDQVTTLCKQYNLWDAYVYVWNTALMDYVSPMWELLQLASTAPAKSSSTVQDGARHELAQKIFPYMSFTLTGRIYPSADTMDDDRADLAKSQMYGALFSGRGNRQEPLALLKAILKFDTANFMSTLNEAFEDAFLNTTQEEEEDATLHNAQDARSSGMYNRQIIIGLLLDVMETGFDADDTVYLDMFIARNLPKYRQYIILSGSTLQKVFTRLCNVADPEYRDDAQLSVEYLMSVYQPPNIFELIPVLYNARFYRILKAIYRQEEQWSELVETYLKDDENKESVFDVMLECLSEGSRLDQREREHVRNTILQHASELVQVDAARTAIVINQVLPRDHGLVLDTISDLPWAQFEYLQTLFEPSNTVNVSPPAEPALLEMYVRLICQFRPDRVVSFISSLQEGDMRLESVLPAMEQSGTIDAAVILLARQGQVRDAMNRLTRQLASLQTALEGVLSNAAQSPDEVATNETIEDLLSSVDKYAKVGIWLCDLQSKNTPKSKPMAISPKRASMQQPLSFDEQLWLDFLLSVVSIAQNIGTPFPEQSGPGSDMMADTLRVIVQDAFTALLASTSSAKAGNRAADDFAFLRILRAFLSGAVEISPSLSQLRSVISSIFSAYAYEESLLALSNDMLDKNLFIQVEEVSKLRSEGWRPRGQTCEICKKRVWGPGTGMKVWDAWESKQKQRSARLEQMQKAKSEVLEESASGKGKAAAEVPQQNGEDEVDELEGNNSSRPGFGPVVVFACRHIYHKSCLKRSQIMDSREGEVTRDLPAALDNLELRCPACA